MKISGYYKGLGCLVRLIESYEELKNNNYDDIFISKVFDFSKIDESILELNNVHYGGTGFFFDGGPDLPYEIEHHMPDYSLYNDYIEHDVSHKNKSTYWKDYKDYSIGFATRGCFRKCAFCVNKKYDKVQFHSHVSEWLDESRKAIYLWDDNIFAYSKWNEVFEELKETGKPFQFRQGLDIRLLTPEKAKVLNESKYHGDIIFAFDHIEEKAIIENKLKLWREFSSKSTKLYVLAGFDGQDEKEVESVLERISIIMKYNCLPYIMRHKNYTTSPHKDLFIQLARWCNMPQFFKKTSFREFCESNQKYHKNKETDCAALKALKRFEEQYPEISKKYFDLKFENFK